MRPPHTPPQFVGWTLSDQYVVRGRWWPGARGASTGVLYFHGIQSHGGWYEWSAALLAARGLPVALPDRRGSGLNERDRGDTPSMERWLEDIDELAAAVGAASGVQQFALVGVSWGGKLALAWALRNPARTARLLLVAPGLFPRVGVGFFEAARIGMNALTGRGTRHAIPLDDPTLFTANPAGQAFIRDDKLKLTTATARFLLQSARLDRRVTRTPARGLIPHTTLILAEQDRIVRNDATVRWMQRVCARPCEVIELAGAAHTLEFEADTGGYEKALITWAGEVAEGL
jgi:alpha-beta hydrolase superfamily lysophospholipase